MPLLLQRQSSSSPTGQLFFDSPNAASLLFLDSFLAQRNTFHACGERDRSEPPNNGFAPVDIHRRSARSVDRDAALVLLTLHLRPIAPGEQVRRQLGCTVTRVGYKIVCLLPESLAALNAAQFNRLQTSLNLALGSALATIGLTIPAVAAVSIAIDQPLELGLDHKDQVLLAVTLLLGVITLGTGRTTILQGIVHLVVFATLFLAVVP